MPVHPPTTVITKPVPGKGTSPYRGVSWHRHNFKWRATIFKGEFPYYICERPILCCTGSCAGLVPNCREGFASGRHTTSQILTLLIGCL